MASDFHLKIDTVDGEDTHDLHKAEIEVESWSWGESNAAHSLGAGSGAGKVNMQPFNFSMYLNKASSKLLAACATGKHYTSAILSCHKAGGEQLLYLKITLSDVMVTSFQTGGSNGAGQVPMDSISLDYGKIEYEYFTQAADGSVAVAGKAAYDVKAAKNS